MAALQVFSKCSHTTVYAPLFRQPAPCPPTGSKVLKQLLTNRAMNILIVSTEEKCGGGARAAFRLHKALQRTGHTSSMFVERRGYHDDAVCAFSLPMNLSARIKRLFRQTQIRYSLSRHLSKNPEVIDNFSDDRSRYGCSILRQIPECDIINLHWVSGFIDHSSFFLNIPKRRKIVWTLHDMNPFTGGCHYAGKCLKYMDRCGNCPLMAAYREKDLSRKIWKRKKSMYDRIDPGRMQFVTPSRWLAEKARHSALLKKFTVSIIPNGLDTRIFAPRDRKSVRRVLGISFSEKVLLFVSHNPGEHRKGFDLLLKAIDLLADRDNLLLISVGSFPPRIQAQIRHIHLHRIESELLLSLVYSASDVFVIPSLQDNLPNTVLESMACGTPVVGFDTGGIPEMVRHEESGLLAPVSDVKALSASIGRLFDTSPERNAMSLRCRQIIEQEYTEEIQAKRYIQLFEGNL